MLRVVRGHDRRSWSLRAGRWGRRIDPNRVRQAFEPRRALHEAFGMRGIRGQARLMTALEDGGRAPVVDVGRGEIAQAAVMVRVVVPREEIATDAAAVFERGSDPETPAGI